MCFFAFEKVSMHVTISCPTIHNDNLTHCYQFIPVSYSSIVNIYNTSKKITNLTILEFFLCQYCEQYWYTSIVIAKYRRSPLLINKLKNVFFLFQKYSSIFIQRTSWPTLRYTLIKSTIIQSEQASCYRPTSPTTLDWTTWPVDRMVPTQTISASPAAWPFIVEQQSSMQKLLPRHMFTNI